MTSSAHLDRMFRPQSVAIIGASNDPTRISGRTLRYLREGGYQGAVYPINPTRETVQGLRAFSRLGDVPERPDVAIIAVPGAAAREAVKDCADAGVRSVILFSSGFAEAGEEGAQIQRDIADIARASGMRLLGPNCVGVLNSESRFYGTFTQSLDREFPADGPVGVISQSGAFAGHLLYLAKERNLGIRYWGSTGNEADIDLAETIGWMAAQPDIRVIIAYSEGIRNGGALIDAFRLAHANRKAIVLLKVGRSQAGARAAASHTAALAGSDAIYDAVLRQYGVYRARTTEECIDIAYACARGVFPDGDKVGLVSVSGGAGIQMADAAETFGLDVAPMPLSAQRQLKALLPFAAVENPVDVTAQIQNDMDLLTRNLEIMLTEGDYDSIVAFLTSMPNSRSFGPAMKDAISAAARTCPDRLIVLSLLASADIVRSYEEQGFLVFADADRAVQATGALRWFGRRFASPQPDIAIDETRVPLNFDKALSEFEAKRILAKEGVTVLPELLAADAPEAMAAADRMGYPVVLKIVSPDIPHKTEIGGVLLNVQSREEVAEGAERILDRARTAAPHAAIEGVLVAPMAPKGIETIVGVVRDPVFGPMVMFGLGGIFVEILKDVTFRHAPFDETEAMTMIREIKGYGLLEGARGAEPADVEALAKMLAALSRFAARNAETIESIDINPLLVLPRGQGVVALDAVILPRAENAC